MKKSSMWLGNSLKRANGITQNLVDLKINRQGTVIIQDNFKLSDVFCTDTDNENNQFPFKNKGVTDMKTSYKKLPSVNDMTMLKDKISCLIKKENTLSNPIRSEFHRQLSDIHNLYRLIRFEILDPRNQVSSYFSRVHTTLLRRNWNKIKASIVLAEAYNE